MNTDDNASYNNPKIIEVTIHDNKNIKIPPITAVSELSCEPQIIPPPIIAGIRTHNIIA